ncbi:hypothetical protein B0H12DRAFT_420187 [Mycena haematopus]|nr:hypothetical protein B0H12DRAFT_420187 [Mycena haematopus]
MTSPWRSGQAFPPKYSRVFKSHSGFDPCPLIARRFPLEWLLNLKVIVCVSPRQLPIFAVMPLVYLLGYISAQENLHELSFCYIFGLTRKHILLEHARNPFGHTVSLPRTVFERIHRTLIVAAAALSCYFLLVVSNL